MTKWRVPLANIDLGRAEFGAVQRVLESKWLTMGSVTQEFERRFAEYIGVEYAVAVANGTAALHLACKAVGIGDGDEVIAPSLSFVATANAVVYCGGHPVFADIQSEADLTLSPEDIASRITRRTKAIIVVHYSGQPCEMGAIREIASQFGLAVIEDAAHAPGARYRGTNAGALGDIACFSFFGNKNMTTGEGGMVVTNDAGLAEQARRLRSHGMTTLTWDRYQGHARSYDVVTLGYNYRMSEIAAALGIVQLGKLDENNARRRQWAGLYRERLRNMERIGLLVGKPSTDSSSHLFPVILAEDVDRARFMEALSQRGVQTSIHYPPIHLFTYYRQLLGQEATGLEKTESVGRREVTLPLYSGMTVEQIDYVVESVEDALAESVVRASC